jgi:hypothetical protein
LPIQTRLESREIADKDGTQNLQLWSVVAKRSIRRKRRNVRNVVDESGDIVKEERIRGAGPLIANSILSINLMLLASMAQAVS